MLHHYYKKLVVGFALVVLGACDNVPDQIAETHRQASVAERTAVHALNALEHDMTRAQLEELRGEFETAADEARELRDRLRAEIETAIDERWLSSEKLPEAMRLNGDLLRCHDTLRERTEDAFKYVSTGRARRASLDDVWGIVDPRKCFDELAPAWDQLLR